MDFKKAGKAKVESKFKKAEDLEYPQTARAMRAGVYGQYRNEGDTFEIQEAAEKGTWMEIIDEDGKVIVPAGKPLDEDKLAKDMSKQQMEKA